MYVVKSIPELVQHVQQTEMHKYGKNLAFVHQLDAFDDNSRSLMSFFYPSVSGLQLLVQCGYP